LQHMQHGHSESTGSKMAVRLDTIIAGCIGLFLVICNVIRICTVPLTVDESPSRSDLFVGYGDYVHLRRVTANIHILNSILRKASIEAFGNTPFFLRLPNLLAQILFLVCCYRLLCRLFKESQWRIAAFLICALNPFVLEFWGYSRGYGLAIGFMMASIYFLIVYIEDKKSFQVWSALVVALAAVWSNFALLNYYVALCGVLLVLGLFREHLQAFLRKSLPAISVVSVVLLALIYNPIRKLRASGELYYGGENGLISDTITSLVKESMYISDPQQPVVGYVVKVVVALLSLCTLYWAFVFFRKSRGRHDKGIALCLLALIPLLSLIVQHHLLGTRYLIDRTALFIIVLIPLSITYGLYQIRARVKYLGEVAVFLMAALITWNFAQHVNLHKSRPWWLDNQNVQVLEYLAKKPQPPGRRLKLRVSWIQMPSMDYYIYTRYDSLFEPLVFSKEPPGPADTVYDYCYLPGDDAKTLSAVYVEDTLFDPSSKLYRKK